MTNANSKLSGDNKVADRILHHVKSFPPPISFTRKKKEKRDKSDYREFEIKLNPDDANSQITKKNFLIFEEGNPESWCDWRKQADDVCRLLGATAADAKERVYLSLLRGRAQESFMTYKAEQVAANASRSTAWDANKVLLHTLNDIALEIFPSKHAYRRQVFYMKYHLYIGEGITVKEFENRLNWMNQSLQYFPLIRKRNGQHRECKSLEEDQLCDIINIAKKPNWTAKMMEANKDPYDYNQKDLIEYLERLEVVDSIRKSSQSPTSKGDKRKKKKSKRKRKDEDDDDEDSTDSRPHPKRTRKPCKICGKYHKGKCWHDKSNTKGGNPRLKLHSGSEKTYSLSELTELSNAFRRSSKKKRKTESNLEESNMFKNMSINNNSSDSDSDYFESSYAIDRPLKRPKRSHRCSEVLVRIPGTDKVLKALLDSGTSSSIIKKEFVHENLSNYKTKRTRWNTMGGVFTTRRKAKVQFQLSEFSLRKKINWIFHVDETQGISSYDMIIGDDILQELGMDLLYSAPVPTIRWDHVEVAMKPKGTLNDPRVMEHAHAITIDLSSKPLRKAEERRVRILDVDEKTYANIDLQAFVKTLDYLSPNEQTLLLKQMEPCRSLFSGGLATAKVQPVDFELTSNAKPHHIRQPFSIPEVYKSTTKKEINRLCTIGVLEKRSDSEWACGTFIIPKKTHDVRVVTDFRKLNEMIIRRPFPIPKIKDLLTSLKGFTYASAIDLSMGYYSIPLSEKAQELTSFLLPWGKYRYKRLPMGIKTATDIFQEVMTHVLGDLPFVRCYLDDVLLITNGTYEDHCSKLQNVLARLDAFNFRCRPDKCKFAVDRVDYLGYVLTRTGLTPQPKKVEAIHRMVAPSNKKTLRRFLGMINFYRDMWRQRSHILAPLTAMTSNKSQFHWGSEQQKAFEEIKRVIAREVTLTFPDFSKEFHVYTDASDYQLGGVIMQDNKPLAFYSRKLNSAQKNYSTGEKELLSIVEICREFRDILLGQRLFVHTDHKNLLYRSLPTQRLMRWRMLLEEYDAQYLHVKGIDNVVADGVSRLPIEENEEPLETEPNVTLQSYALCHMQRDESMDLLDHSNVSNFDYAKTYVTESDVNETDFPMASVLLKKYQAKDRQLRHLKRTQPEKFSIKEFEGERLLHYDGKIYVPKELQARIISWYHEYLRHPGSNRLESTIAQWFYWPKMSAQVRWHCKTCPICQKWKRRRKKYGHVPAKDAEADPWTQVHVDMMGPLTVVDGTGKKHSFLAFTAIDPATGWFECVPVNDSKAHTVMEAFHNTWLCRYPRPTSIRFDNGTEFKSVFEAMCLNYHMKKKPTTSYNPRSNGIIERIHQVLRDSLVTFEMSELELSTANPFDSFVAAASWAIRSSYHSTLKATPGQLVFGRDMLLNLKFRADWAGIRLRKQNLIDKGVVRENKSRVQHDYKVGDKVLYDKPGILPKMDAPRTGPFAVKQVHVNGTVTIEKGAVIDRVNIRNVTPFFE